MINPTITIGAPKPGGRICDCEREGCHRGNCQIPAAATLHAFGFSQQLCARCTVFAVDKMLESGPVVPTSGQEEA